MRYSLSELALVDAGPQPEYDNLTNLASRIIGAPVSLVSIVDFANSRQYFKSQVGLTDPWATTRQTPLTHSFCQHVVQENKPLVVSNAPEHPLVKDNLAIGELGVIAYLGVPIYAEAPNAVGALCVIDGSPRFWQDSDLKTMQQFAACVSDTIRLKAALLDSERMRGEQSQFTFAVSHDLKSPTNTMRMLIEELKDFGALGEDGHDVLADMALTNQRMGQLVDDVLEYSCVVGEKLKVDKIDLSDLVDSILIDLTADIAAAGAKIRRDTLPIIDGHGVQLRILFQNLISNAVKFRAPDRPLVIDITTQDAGNDVHINVTDNGIGIPAKHREEVFGLFKRLHARAGYSGTGLGLSVCRRVVCNHKGIIAINQGKDGGTNIALTLARTYNG